MPYRQPLPRTLPWSEYQASQEGVTPADSEKLPYANFPTANALLLTVITVRTPTTSMLSVHKI